MTTPTLLELGLDVADKVLLAEAAALSGKSLAGFVLAAAREKAQALMDPKTRISLCSQDFEAFISDLDRPFEPNEALSTALPEARKVPRALDT